MDSFDDKEVISKTKDQIVDQSLDSSIKDQMEFLQISATSESMTTDDNQDHTKAMAPAEGSYDLPKKENQYTEHITAEENGSEAMNACEQSSDDETNRSVQSEEVERPFVSRYPLKYRWQLWFWRANQGVKVVWTQALQKVCQPFDTIEGFWRLYHHTLCVHQLTPPSDYCVFKEGITPMWEDSRNINGGKWTLDFAKTATRMVNPHLDEIWLEVLLCLIGEGFNEFGEEICGAVVNIRAKEDRISVWTVDAGKSVANLKIGEILKIRSGYEGKMKYEAHSTSQKIAEEKDRFFDTKLNVAPKPRAKPVRRSCVF